MRTAARERPPLLDKPLRLFGKAFFKVYNDIRVDGSEHVPSAGAVIIASNHPTYLDPAFLVVGLKRPVRFMAWERPFRLPFLGALLRSYGSIPVDMKNPGRSSFEAAVKVLRSGEVFGIFPEGGRTKRGNTMNPVKSGVARLAMLTGAPIVPTTITGGSAVWPKHQFLPRPGPIRVQFHPPIRVPPKDPRLWRRDKTAEAAIVERVLEAIHQKLIPAARAEERMGRLLLSEPSPPSPAVEGIPFLFLPLSWWFLPSNAWRRYAAPASPLLAGYLLLILIEQATGARGRAAKTARNVAPWAVLAWVARAAMRSLPAWELAAAAGFIFGMAWLAWFRFSTYRRFRAAALLLGYAGWLLRVRSLPS